MLARCKFFNFVVKDMGANVLLELQTLSYHKLYEVICICKRQTCVMVEPICAM